MTNPIQLPGWGFVYPDENLMVDPTNSLGAPTGKYAERHGLLQSATKYIQARWTRAKAVTHHIDSTVYVDTL